MTLHDIRRWLNPWFIRRNRKAMTKAIPGFAVAAEKEQACLRRGDTRGLGKARRDKALAVNMALAGKRWSLPSMEPDQADRIRETY